MDGSATGAESQGCAEKAFELVPLVRLEISMCLGWVGKPKPKAKAKAIGLKMTNRQWNTCEAKDHHASWKRWKCAVLL